MSKELSELRDASRALTEMLDNPETGLATWWMLLESTIERVKKAIKAIEK